MSVQDHHDSDVAVALAVLERLEAGEAPLAAARSDEDRKRIRRALYRLANAKAGGTCAMPAERPCPEPPIASHTVQRAGPLSRLADATGHVLMMEDAVNLDKLPVIEMRRFGVGRATTFPGLCREHDAELFRPIDTRPIADCTEHQLFLLSYRTVLKATFETGQTWNQTRKLLRLVVNENGSTEAQFRAAAETLFTYLSLSWLRAIASAYGDLYRARQFTGELRHVARGDLPVLPFAASELFEPAFDQQGRRRPLSASGALPAFVTLNVIPEAQGSVVALSYAAIHQKEVADLVEPLRVTANADDLVDLVWEAALRYGGDNVVVAPDHWARVPERKRSRILRFVNDCRLRGGWIPMRPRSVSLFERD